MTDKTDILIVHINGEKVIKNCLKSIFKNTKNMQVYLMFNGTTDKSRDIVKKEFPKVKTIESKKLIGFAEASNILAKKATSKYLLFLNNDVEVERGWLDELLKTMNRHPNCVACQPKIKSFYKRDMFEYAGAGGGFIDKYGYPFCRGRIFDTIEKDYGQYNDEIRVFWACGVCLFVKRDFFIKSGKFDEDLFMYAEETDFCWRTNLYGKEIWYCPKATIYHMGSFSINKQKLNYKKEYLISRNHILLLLKNYSLFSLLKIIPMRIILEISAAIKYFPSRTFASLLSSLNLPFTFLFKTIKKRREIQSKRKVGDKDIRKLIYDKSIALEYFLSNKKTFKSLNLLKQ